MSAVINCLPSEIWQINFANEQVSGNESDLNSERLSTRSSHKELIQFRFRIHRDAGTLNSELPTPKYSGQYTLTVHTYWRVTQCILYICTLYIIRDSCKLELLRQRKMSRPQEVWRKELLIHNLWIHLDSLDSTALDHSNLRVPGSPAVSRVATNSIKRETREINQVNKFGPS